MPDLIRFRRMFGLFGFFYGCLHFTAYIWLDKFLDLAEIRPSDNLNPEPKNWKLLAKRLVHGR